MKLKIYEKATGRPRTLLNQDVIALFLILMFANGTWHVTWAKVEKRYVLGLVTAPLHIIVFLVFYFYYFVGY